MVEIQQLKCGEFKSSFHVQPALLPSHKFDRCGSANIVAQADTLIGHYFNTRRLWHALDGSVLVLRDKVLVLQNKKHFALV